MLKTTIEPNCQITRRLYVVMKFYNTRNMYGFSREYWRYENWTDPDAILGAKKYRVIVTLSGDNEMIVPTQWYLNWKMGSGL